MKYLLLMPLILLSGCASTNTLLDHFKLQDGADIHYQRYSGSSLKLENEFAIQNGRIYMFSAVGDSNYSSSWVSDCNGLSEALDKLRTAVSLSASNLLGMAHVPPTNSVLDGDWATLDVNVGVPDNLTIRGIETSFWVRSAQKTYLMARECTK